MCSMRCVLDFFFLFFFSKVTRLRVVYRSFKRVENYYVCVRELPADLSANRLFEHLESIYPLQVVSVLMCL